VVVEDNRRRVEALRAHDIPAVYGGCDGRWHASCCKRPSDTPARRCHTQRISDAAHYRARAGDLAHFERQGVDIAIMGKRELALGLLDYTLQSLGVSEERTYSIVQRVRRASEGGAFERRSAEGLSDLSESQPHHDRTDGRDIP
jgi:hypothetical protein